MAYDIDRCSYYCIHGECSYLSATLIKCTCVEGYEGDRCQMVALDSIKEESSARAGIAFALTLALLLTLLALGAVTWCIYRRFKRRTKSPRIVMLEAEEYDSIHNL
uniref:Epigen-like n=1 Tax=Petromyzon marinus TaxID=7757 RepID=A0AAJ7SR39_PETMA|nr:epigen-like [Petromyzon marinus]